MSGDGDTTPPRGERIQLIILGLLRGEVFRTPELSRRFGVCESTIRRDFQYLRRHWDIERTCVEGLHYYSLEEGSVHAAPSVVQSQ